MLLQCHLVRTRRLNEDGRWVKSLQPTAPPLPAQEGESLSTGAMIAREAILLLARSLQIWLRQQLEKYFHSCFWVNFHSEYQYHIFSIFTYLAPFLHLNHLLLSVIQLRRALCWQTENALNTRKYNSGLPEWEKAMISLTRNSLWNTHNNSQFTQTGT